MGIFSFNKKTVEVPKPVQETENLIFKATSFSRPELPVIKEIRQDEYVWYGADNNYPAQLIEFLNTSSIHNAIVQSKSKIISGKDCLFDGKKVDSLDPTTKLKINEFYNNPSGTEDNLNDLILKMSFDWTFMGEICVEVIWSKNFLVEGSKPFIARVKHIDATKIRVGKENESGIVESYYYSKNWGNKRIKPVEIYAFDPNREIHDYTENNQRREDLYRQLIFIRNARPGTEYYGSPSYIAALSWISIDSQMGQFHLSNISNGFSPSMSVKFFKKPESPEIRDEIVKNMMKQFAGARNAGKVMTFFSDGKDLAPEIAPIGAQQLDKMFLVLGEQVVQNIVSAHRAQPALQGISLPGKLGYSNEMISSYAIFDNTVIEPEQMIIERLINKILFYKSLGDVKFSIEKLNPLEDIIKPQ